MKARKKFQPLSSKDVCLIYQSLVSAGEVSFPLTEGAQLKTDALVANINGANFGVPHYQSAEEKTVAYLYFIIKNHPFTDGNKRTALIAFTTLVELNELKFSDSYFGSQESLEMLPILVEKIKLEDHQELIKLLSQALFV